MLCFSFDDRGHLHPFLVVGVCVCMYLMWLLRDPTVCEYVFVTYVHFLPPDKGTVQKVIVLPTNRSLDEDLILEELEVFKVSLLSFLLFHSFSFPPHLTSKAGRTAHLATTQRPGSDRQRQGGIQEMDVVRTAAQSDGKHADRLQEPCRCPE